MSITAATAARGLTELAETMGADLVVIGSSDTHGAGRVALGRTAGRLLRGARRPVAIAASGSREAGPFRHVGVAFDGSPEAELALRTAFAIAARDRAAVSLFQALLEAPFTSEDEQSVRWKTRLRAQATLDAAAESAPAGVNPRTVLLRGEPSRVIADGCEGVVDLLVTGSRAYGPLQRAVLGSVSAELVDGAPCPVLVPGRHPEGAARDGEPVADVRLAD